MPLISFVIPVYNKQAHIANCINSVLNQSIEDIEIICVNDCSTDESLDILYYYRDKDSRIKLIDLVANQGRSNARNIGNKKASASIICVQDADDISYPDRAKLTLDAFKKGIDVLYGGFDHVFSNTKCRVLASELDWDKNLSTLFNYICHSTMAYKKDKVLKIEYSNGDWSDMGIEDWKLQYDFYKKGYKFGFIREPILKYEMSSNSISLNRDENKIQKLKRQYINEKS